MRLELADLPTKYLKSSPGADPHDLGGIKEGLKYLATESGDLDLGIQAECLAEGEGERVLTLRIITADTEELKTQEIKIHSTTNLFKIGEGDFNHFRVANEKKMLDSQFAVITKNGSFYIRDLGFLHLTRFKVKPD